MKAQGLKVDASTYLNRSGVVAGFRPLSRYYPSTQRECGIRVLIIFFRSGRCGVSDVHREPYVMCSQAYGQQPTER